MIDDYLSNPSKLSNQITPNARYYTHTESWWELQNQYRPVPGKYLGIAGIANDRVSWVSKLHNQYGFTNIMCNFSQVSIAHPGIQGNLGFNYDSIMINLGLWATQADINNNHPPNKSRYNYYFVDEPIQRYNDVYQAIVKMGFYTIYIGFGGSKLLFSDYYWPDGSSCWFSGADGSTAQTILTSSNTYIMCDEYGHCGSLCGNTHDYWNEYKAFYGLGKYQSNFISLQSNAIGDWGDLLNVAMAWSSYGCMNPIWIWAGDVDQCAPWGQDYVDENRIALFCYTAWKNGWLLEFEKHHVVVYACGGLNCNWPNGPWEVISDYYDTQQYVHY